MPIFILFKNNSCPPPQNNFPFYVPCFSKKLVDMKINVVMTTFFEKFTSQIS